MSRTQDILACTIQLLMKCLGNRQYITMVLVTKVICMSRSLWLFICPGDLEDTGVVITFLIHYLFLQDADRLRN